MSVTCDRSFFFSGFLHQINWPPRYNLNIVESGVKHPKPTYRLWDPFLEVLAFCVHYKSLMVGKCVSSVSSSLTSSYIYSTFHHPGGKDLIINHFNSTSSASFLGEAVRYILRNLKMAENTELKRFVSTKLDIYVFISIIGSIP